MTGFFEFLREPFMVRMGGKLTKPHERNTPTFEIGLPTWIHPRDVPQFCVRKTCVTTSVVAVRNVVERLARSTALGGPTRGDADVVAHPKSPSPARNSSAVVRRQYIRPLR